MQSTPDIHSKVRNWTDRIQGMDLDQRYPRNPEIAENLRGLAKLMRPIADEQPLRAHLDSAVPDDFRVQQLREHWVTHKHAEGERDYRYPAHLLGHRRGHVPATRGGPRVSVRGILSASGLGNRTALDRGRRPGHRGTRPRYQAGATPELARPPRGYRV